MTSAPRRWRPSMTLPTLVSFPGMGWLDRITVSLLVMLNHLLSPLAIRERADIGSPCDPVEMMQSSPSGMPPMSAMSSSSPPATFNSPRSRARRMFFFMDSPRVATRRPSSWAMSMICWIRWMWLAKQAVTMRRPFASRNSLRSTGPTEDSEVVWPFSSALVESASSRRIPDSTSMAPIRPRSVKRPSIGLRSSFQSPECRMVPWGVWKAVANPLGTEWVTGMNSQSNGPIWRRSPSCTSMSCVRSRRPASSIRLRARPSVSFDP
jgi:hypothetical protein